MDEAGFEFIDEAYAQDAQTEFSQQCQRALAQFATFFAPARVVSFASPHEFVRAAQSHPNVFGSAHIFLLCDAAAVPKDVHVQVAAAALCAGGLAFELTNSGKSVARSRADVLKEHNDRNYEVRRPY